ncbi:MAG: enoyl-CoA hydratase/isomerase family protein [Deltaproteobacteria bacterium]|nr:enoyl-CoA hydratase/isomerase family protein [Deltaproteobacteria bacterium]MBW2053283.1 enoyl-CoA hydratase/isomerase family protein [Deltaproteobacteria bacterium]MBW2140815.1 enoyl-CoA hydratase/isomerase family protein [Deltaproteobacteria bacterium]MBW2324423.1 enoyl-CoA hydratase/isomerase family protein [Deltaproteobacteria bacterium]
MSYKDITFEQEGYTAVVTLNRPQTFNALSAGLRSDLHAALKEVTENDDIRALVITGAGRGFCSGADLSGPRPEPPDNQNFKMDDLEWMGRLALVLYELEKPIIGAINGIAAGAGMSLALACDLRVGSEKSGFKTVFMERAISPDTGMTFFLPRIVGYSRAIDLIISCRRIDCHEAYRLGLLDRLVDHENLMEEALKLAGEIGFWPPLAVRSTKRVLKRNMEEPSLANALRNEVSGLYFARRAVKDQEESAKSWVEKRPPKFTGK